MITHPPPAAAPAASDRLYEGHVCAHKFSVAAGTPGTPLRRKILQWRQAHLELRRSAVHVVVVGCWVLLEHALCDNDEDLVRDDASTIRLARQICNLVGPLVGRHGPDGRHYAGWRMDAQRSASTGDRAAEFALPGQAADRFTGAPSSKRTTLWVPQSKARRSGTHAAFARFNSRSAEVLVPAFGIL